MSLVHHLLVEESELNMTILTVIIFSIIFSPLLPPLVCGGVEVGERIYNNLIRRPNELAAPDGEVALPIPASLPTGQAQGDEARRISTAA
jgi:hypothetical protein